MEIKNQSKKSVYSSQGDYFKGLNTSSPEFKAKMKDGGFQRNPEEYNYKGSKEAAKAKNIFK
ncbi:hypothetical protein CHF27_002780 [Romboutsia maritimum]|uniref:Uncharacterized protein n=1 Tax=Romboutsia maritimum TaxID=2020948 RepID=A0A371IVS0_9FIRM|nr:hypothetical protein [Romboutsia maritimum]RDY24582.1 hypothetical protein CHF27_002780 [Romboutsia maritimum]